MTHVLLAEDDPAIAEPLARAFGREGYDVQVQGTGHGAIDHAGQADLIVLDKDIFQLPPAEIHSAKVLTTIYEGKAVYGALDMPMK